MSQCLWIRLQSPLLAESCGLLISLAMLVDPNFQGNRFQSFKFLSELGVILSSLWLLHPRGFQTSKKFLQLERQPRVSGTVILQAPTRNSGHSSCPWTRTANTTGTFSAVFVSPISWNKQRENGDKANLELFPARWITDLERLARREDHVCGSWESVGVLLLGARPRAFHVDGDICSIPPAGSSMGLGSFPGSPREYLQCRVCLGGTGTPKPKGNSPISAERGGKKTLSGFLRWIPWGCQSTHTEGTGLNSFWQCWEVSTEGAGVLQDEVTESSSGF